jgi:hypothetical protein
MTKPHALKEFHSPADSAKLPLPPRTLKLRSPAKDSSPAAPGSPGPRAAGTSARLPSPRSSPQRLADRAAPVRPGGGNTQSTKAAASRRPWRPANRRGAGAAWSADDAVDEAASETSFLLTRSQWERQQLEEEEELEEFEQLESIVTPVPAASVGCPSCLSLRASLPGPRQPLLPPRSTQPWTPTPTFSSLVSGNPGVWLSRPPRRDALRPLQL